MSRQKLELKPLFLERMKNILNKKEFETYLESLKTQSPVSIRVNTLKISPEKLKKRLEKKGWIINQKFKDHPEIFIIEGKLENNKSDEFTNKNIKEIKVNNSNDIVSLRTQIRDGSRGSGGESIEKENISRSKEIIPLSPGEIGRSLEHLLGYYYVQEIASMLPSIVLHPLKNERILDLCASPGSKTTQMASYMENKGLIIANEIKLGRIKILSSNLGRCGITNTLVTMKNGIQLCKRLHEKNIYFDKILIDAPCSGEGTLRSSPKTSLMWNPKTIKTLSKIQKHLVESALKILKPNGVLVYSTCTHAPEENEEVVSYIINEFKNMNLEKINLPSPLKYKEGITKWQEKEYNKNVKLCCRIYPQDNDTDGFFISKLRKIK